MTGCYFGGCDGQFAEVDYSCFSNADFSFWGVDRECNRLVLSTISTGVDANVFPLSY